MTWAMLHPASSAVRAMLIADSYTAQVRLFNKGKQKLARVSRLVGQTVAQAAYMHLTGSHWIALQDAIERVAGLAAAAWEARNSDAYQAALDQLPKIEQQIADTIDSFIFSDIVDVLESENKPSIQLQTIPLLNNIVPASQYFSPVPVGLASPSTELPASPSNSSFKARPAELTEMFPTTAAYVTAKNPRWSEIHAATSRLRHNLDIRIGTYVDALDKLGPAGAAVAVMITAER